MISAYFLFHFQDKDPQLRAAWVFKGLLYTRTLCFRVIGEASFQSSVLSASPGSCCIAPKSGSCKKAAQQMDTYSFGVMLFELVTGRRADEHIESGDGEFLDISQTHRPNKQYYEL
ncbi:probably inactive leucine-rich repeat receptor-like protein kinase At5g06940 [Daucus carota subsp. sativus]|uniref:probably inactive leucine-rich repeat receptor-like protein kinase At5g06940 n=1 Tax=Daucus carota subsp. sativus TaxID=79200 RepID=UPI003083E2A2